MVIEYYYHNYRMVDTHIHTRTHEPAMCHAHSKCERRASRLNGLLFPCMARLCVYGLKNVGPILTPAS